MANQLINTETGEISNINVEQHSETIHLETPTYTIYKLPNGKFQKRMKYQRYFSHIPTNEEEQVHLFNLLNSNGDSDEVIRMGDMVNEDITVTRVYINPYESFDEETGKNENGVTSMIYDEVKNIYIATSSKSVYHTLHRMFEMFGTPDSKDYKPITVTVTGTRKDRGVQIDLKLKSI